VVESGSLENCCLGFRDREFESHSHRQSDEPCDFSMKSQGSFVASLRGVFPAKERISGFFDDVGKHVLTAGIVTPIISPCSEYKKRAG
jgi:hypothetical protein